jgi:hypothetical protein
VADALRWLGELSQHDARSRHRLFQEIADCKELIDRWNEGEVWLHINMRFRSVLLDVEPTEFCAWLRPRPVGSRPEPSGNAVNEPQFKESDPLRYSYDWLNRPVLVSVRKRVKNREDVSVNSRLPCSIGLVPPHLGRTPGSFARSPFRQSSKILRFDVIGK